ncbi:MAG: hypothetical protein HYU66_24500, partial [Armatimonadetes bacterium]|nr:hypothetical protein [Armatimonadota bacterium]
MTGISAVLLAGILADPAMLPREWGEPIPVENVAVVADAAAAEPIVAALRGAGAKAERVEPSAALALGGLSFVPAVTERTVVLVGGIHTNAAILPLYGGYLSFGDAAYPGEDNFVIRPVAAPFGPGTNAVVVEASSPDGCLAGAARLAGLLGAAADHRPPNVMEPHLTPGALQRFSNVSTHAQRYVLTGAADAAQQGVAQVLAAANGRGWFDAGDYGIERWVRDVQLLQDSPAGTPEERLRLDQALFTTCQLSYGLWWCRGDGNMIGGRHQTMGTSCIAAAVQLLRRRGKPNDEARALIEKWWAGTGAYWRNACTTFHDDLEGFPIYCSPEPTLDQAFAFGWDGYLREQLPLAALRVYAATDNQGFYAGTGTYEECRPGDVYKTMPWGWILSAAGYFQPGAGWDWLAAHWPNAYPWTWGVGRQFGGARMFATGRDARPPERLLGVVKVPLGPYRFARLAHERNDSGRYTLVPEERCFEKICCRDNFSPDGQYLLLQGYQPIGSDNVLPLDNNNLIRYDDLGHVWLHSNSEKSGNLHRSAVYCSDGLNAVPSPAAAELLALHSGPRLGLTATKLPNAGPCDWTRHLFWRRGRRFVLIDLLRANRAGQAALTCSFRTPQRAELLSDGMLAREGDAAMRVVNADAVRLSLDGGREQEGAAVPTLLRESRLLDGAAGATAVYRNLVYSYDSGHPAALEARPVGDNALLVRGTARGEDELALLAVRTGEGPLRVGPFETDGVMLYAGSGGTVQAGGTVVKLDGQALGEVADPQVSRALERLWGAAKPASHPGNAPAAGGGAKVLWRAEPFAPLPDAAAAPVLTSTPPGAGQIGSLFDRIIPRGPTVTWPAGDVTLTLDLRESRPLRLIDFQVGQFGGYNTIAPAASLPASRAVEAELSNDGFQADRRATSLTFAADRTYENIHKGTVWPILRWTCGEIGGAARWVRLTFRAAVWPGALGMNELSVRPAGPSSVRVAGAVLRDVNGDGAAELLTWSDQAELAAVKLDGSLLWRRRLPGFITAAEAYPDLGAGRRVLVTTR